MFFPILLFLVVMGSTAFGQDAIQCHVKAGYGNQTTVNKGVVPCTSQMCLAFYDFSDNFWATNCFQIGAPLSLGKTFKKVAIRNKKRSKNSYFFYCLSDNCNAEPFTTMENGNLNGIMLIMPDPISFDYKLFPSLGKEPLPPRNLQNAGYTFVDAPRTFNGGYVFPATKTVWASFQFSNASNKITHLKLNYNILTSTLTITYGNVKSVKKLSNQFSPDEQFYILFDVTALSQQGAQQYYISVNNENVLILSKSQLGDVIRASYGGKWKYVDLAGMYQISFPTYLAKNQSCSAQTSNSKMTVIPIKNFTNIELELPMIAEGQRKSFELRSNLCPGSDMIKFDVALVKHFNGKFFYHSSVYFRKKQQWQHMFTQMIAKTSTCSSITVTEYDGMVSFSCGNDVINMISIKYKISTFLKGLVTNMFTVNSAYLWNEIKYLVY